MSLDPQAGNPEHHEDQNADEHDNSRYSLLQVCCSQAAIVGFVISDSSRALFREGAWIAPVTQVPRFLAVAPGADLGSGNEVTVARHGRFVTEPPPTTVNNPLLHRPLRGDPSARPSGFVRA